MLKRSLFLLLVLFQGNAVGETVVLDLQQAVDRALAVDPRITEKERKVDYARAQLREARNADGWRVGMNTFLGIAPKTRGGFFEKADGSIGIPPNAFDINGLAPWYYLSFSVIKPLHT